ncbi:MAG: hypothetical protein ACREVA_02240 [Burkholderiales bacterium]
MLVLDNLDFGNISTLVQVPINFVDLTSSANITTANNQKVHTNIGASALVVATLPPTARTLRYIFHVLNTNGIKLTANGSEVIRIGGASAINMTCTQVGGAVSIYGVPGGWQAESSTRTWVDS